MVIDKSAVPFGIEKLSDSELKVYWADKSLIFAENSIDITAGKLVFHFPNAAADIRAEGNGIMYTFGGTRYSAVFTNAELRMINDSVIEINIRGSSRITFVRNGNKR